MILIAGGVYYAINIHRATDNGIVTQNVLAPVHLLLDTKGVLHETVPEQVVTKVDMKHLTDSIRKTLKVSVVTHENTSVQVLHDTFVVHVYDDPNSHDLIAKDSTKDIQITFRGSSLAQLGSFDISLTPDTLSEISAIKRRFLRSDLHTTYFTHSNSLVKTVSGSSLTYSEQKPILVFGITGGVNIMTGKPFWGIGATLPLFSIKTR